MTCEKRKEVDGEDGIGSQSDGLKMREICFFGVIPFFALVAPHKHQAYDRFLSSLRGAQKASTPFPQCLLIFCLLSPELRKTDYGLPGVGGG